MYINCVGCTGMEEKSWVLLLENTPSSAREQPEEEIETYY